MQGAVLAGEAQRVSQPSSGQLAEPHHCGTSQVTLSPRENPLTMGLHLPLC